jgi:hypothetical protein
VGGVRLQEDEEKMEGLDPFVDLANITAEDVEEVSHHDSLLSFPQDGVTRHQPVTDSVNACPPCRVYWES